MTDRSKLDTWLEKADKLIEELDSGKDDTTYNFTLAKEAWKATIQAPRGHT
jgi:hypothetical protein